MYVEEDFVNGIVKLLNIKNPEDKSCKPFKSEAFIVIFNVIFENGDGASCIPGSGLSSGSIENDWIIGGIFVMFNVVKIIEELF